MKLQEASRESGSTTRSLRVYEKAQKMYQDHPQSNNTPAYDAALCIESVWPGSGTADTYNDVDAYVCSDE
jgi:hypothetical protein